MLSCASLQKRKEKVLHMSVQNCRDVREEKETTRYVPNALNSVGMSTDSIAHKLVMRSMIQDRMYSESRVNISFHWSLGGVLDRLG
jgi:hypothetical protein